MPTSKPTDTTTQVAQPTQPTTSPQNNNNHNPNEQHRHPHLHAIHNLIRDKMPCSPLPRTWDFSLHRKRPSPRSPEIWGWVPKTYSDPTLPDGNLPSHPTMAGAAKKLDYADRMLRAEQFRIQAMEAMWGEKVFWDQRREEIWERAAGGKKHAVSNLDRMAADMDLIRAEGYSKAGASFKGSERED